MGEWEEKAEDQDPEAEKAKGSVSSSTRVYTLGCNTGGDQRRWGCTKSLLRSPRHGGDEGFQSGPHWLSQWVCQLEGLPLPFSCELSGKTYSGQAWVWAPCSLLRNYHHHGSWKQQIWAPWQLWGPDIYSEGAVRTTVPQKALQESLSPPLPASGGLLACGCLSPISVSLLTWPSSLCVWDSHFRLPDSSL